MTDCADDSSRSLKAVKLIVFDLDGTLIDAFQDITNAVNHMLQSMDRPPLPLETVKRHVGHGVRELAARLLGTHEACVIDASLPLLVEYYKRHPHVNARVYDGVVPTLGWLRARGIKMAVASNKPDTLTRKILAAMGLAPLFDAIYGESQEFARKPDPAVLRHIMGEFRAAPDETVVVGDTDIDIEFARGAGARVVTVTYGQLTGEQLRAHKPDYIINSFTELIPLFNPDGVLADRNSCP